jgi:hypothetical protein
MLRLTPSRGVDRRLEHLRASGHARLTRTLGCGADREPAAEVCTDRSPAPDLAEMVATLDRCADADVASPCTVIKRRPVARHRARRTFAAAGVDGA